MSIAASSMRRRERRCLPPFVISGPKADVSSAVVHHPGDNGGYQRIMLSLAQGNEQLWGVEDDPANIKGH